MLEKGKNENKKMCVILKMRKQQNYDQIFQTWEEKRERILTREGERDIRGNSENKNNII